MPGRKNGVIRDNPIRGFDEAIHVPRYLADTVEIG